MTTAKQEGEQHDRDRLREDDHMYLMDVAGMSETEEQLIARCLERIEGKTWPMFMCAEPDGDRCAVGTLPNMLQHRCKALTAWHEWHRRADRGEVVRDAPETPHGPQVVAFEVRAA